MNIIKNEDAPILITGTFRSGTTLISQIMRNHDNINLVYDSVNFMRFSYNRYNSISSRENVKSLLEEIKIRIKKRWDMNFNERKVLRNIIKDDITYARVYNELMRELLLKNSSARIWGEKTTLVWTKIPDFFDMFPEGRVIHIIRDPRAVLASWRKMTHAPGNDYLDSILNCRGSMEKALEYEIRYKNKRYYKLKFEDLVKNPDLVVSSLCDKLEIEFKKNMLNPKNFEDKSGNDWDGNSMFENKLDKISTETIDKWKDKLKKWEIWLTEFLVDELMDEFDYDIMRIDLNQNLLDKIILNIKNSDLATDGLLRYLFTGEGFERFPADPLKPKNWDNGE